MTNRTLRVGTTLAGAATVLLALATPALAHSEVSASDARALAENVTLTFTSEAESTSAGIQKIQIVLPDGVPVQSVALKDAPTGWTLTPDATGYTVQGPALPVGDNAKHSIVVRQLPQGESLPFKTIETYSNGKVSRWIEMSQNGSEPENPAPVLELKPPAPGATPLPAAPAASTAPSPSPTPSVSSSAPAQPAPAVSSSSAAPEATAKDDGGNTGLVVAVVLAALVVASFPIAMWIKRRTRTSA
ncbi:DUF1775 domain-containing protein [Kitasatospora cineracea]|uniref:Uncharacterized protein DUF1775 n=1 Tax=Kitasatospora cineracea TaxID=88074 RepID=A0A8G1UFF8_9ACTN|nr:DUF1775 domain-containing protein [Kitasatospora cineracea]ROR43016.1 uncharacterized protein DUF1775 [Kitasatospora cineracea]